MNWKYWYKIRDKTYEKQTGKQELTEGYFQEDTELLQHSWHDYFILNRVLYHTKAKEIGWIGGFSNLDFFVSQYEIPTIQKCINFDGTPASDWCSSKHKKFIKDYDYQGQYIFHNRWFDNTELDDIDFLWSHINVIDKIKFQNFPKLRTIIFNPVMDPFFIDYFKDEYNGLPCRIITRKIIVYSSHDFNDIFKDCAMLRNFRCKIGYKNTEGHFQEKPIDYPKQICVKPERNLTWSEKLKYITNKKI